MQVRFVLAIALGLALCPKVGAETPQDLADRYNVEGMSAYWQFDWAGAAQSFRKALQEVPDHKLANYNLACVLSLRLSGDRASWHVGEGSPDDPLDQLARAIKVDPDAARKAAHDPDFANIRLTPRFQILIGSDLADPHLMELILVAQGEWYGGRCGAWCGNDLIFFENGDVTKKVFGEDGHGNGHFTYEHGRFTVEPGVITVNFDSGETWHGHFVTEGWLAGTLDMGQFNAYFVAPIGDM